MLSSMAGIHLAVSCSGRPLHLQALLATRSHYLITYVFLVYVIHLMDIIDIVFGQKEWLFNFFLLIIAQIRGH